jgi:hypothetical protein
MSKTAAAEDIMEQVLAASSGVRTYEITTNLGKMRVGIPEGHRITFGPVSPGSKYGGAGEMCLRVYEDATHQRMLITNVTSFRDLSLPVMRAVVRKRGTRKWLAENNDTMMRVLRGEKSSDLEHDWINETELEIDADEYDGEVVPPDPWAGTTYPATAKLARSR